MKELREQLTERSTPEFADFVMNQLEFIEKESTSVALNEHEPMYSPFDICDREYIRTMSRTINDLAEEKIKSLEESNENK